MTLTLPSHSALNFRGKRTDDSIEGYWIQSDNRNRGRLEVKKVSGKKNLWKGTCTDTQYPEGVMIELEFYTQPKVSKVETSDKQIRKKPQEPPVVLENPLLHRRDPVEKSTVTRNRLQGVHEATSEIQSYQPNSCIAAVPPDRWKGEYFNNKNLQGYPSMVRDDGNGFINFNWGNKGPCDSCDIGKDNFSVRWTRTVSFDDGTYCFTVTGDDGIRLYIDDKLWLDQENTTYATDVQLPAGKHTVRLEYYENIVGAIAKLSWQMVSTPEQPAAQSPITYNLNGEWEGKVDNKPVKLSIAQDGNNLSGNIVYDTEFSKTNVKEHLSGEINNDKIVLKGTGYAAKGVTSFSLDTFLGTINSQDRDFIRGNYTDEAGHSGEWFVKRKSTMITQESMPDQSKNQDNYKPETAIQSSRAKLTKAMQKTPGFQIKHKRENYPNSKMYSTVDDAKVKFLDNDSLEIRIKVDRVTINCTWSPKDYAYVGTWCRDILERGPVSKLLFEKRHDDRRMQGKIKLFPRFNSNNEIMCFYGYIMSYNAYIGPIHTWSYGNDYPGTPIKIAPLWGLCPDPEGD